VTCAVGTHQITKFTCNPMNKSSTATRVRAGNGRSIVVRPAMWMTLDALPSLKIAPSSLHTDAFSAGLPLCTNHTRRSTDTAGVAASTAPPEASALASSFHAAGGGEPSLPILRRLVPRPRCEAAASADKIELRKASVTCGARNKEAVAT
jgi:hypothetical protein